MRERPLVRRPRGSSVCDIRISDAPAETAESIARGRILGECTNLARALANEPGNDLTPRVFAERASEIATAAGLAVEVLDEQNIAALKMGLLLGVARGSQEPPRVVVLRHEPPKAVGRSRARARRQRASRSTPAASRSSRPTTWTR